MGLFSQHSAAEPSSVDEFAEFAAADTPNSGVGLLDTLVDSFEHLIEDEPQVTSVLSSGDFDDVEAGEDDPADPLTADRASVGITSVLSRLFSKPARLVEIDVKEAPNSDHHDFEPDETPQSDSEPPPIVTFEDADMVDFVEAEPAAKRSRRRWRRTDQASVPDEQVESPPAVDEVEVQEADVSAESTRDEIADLTVEVEAAVDDVDSSSTAVLDTPDEQRPRRRRRRRKNRTPSGEHAEAAEEVRFEEEPAAVADAEPVVETADEHSERSDKPTDEVGALGAVAALSKLVDDDATQSVDDDDGGGSRGRRRWWRRSRSEKAETAVVEEPTFVEFAEPEPEPEPEIAVGMLTDEDLGLTEPPELSRKERKAMRKAEPRGRRARKKANEQADLDLGSRVMALASTVPDGVQTLDYPKLYQNDDLLQMGLVARRRELAALHPKEDLDTLTAASVLGSVLRMDEELYSLKPRYILRKIVLLIVAAGGAWFIADKVKKQKEAEREAEAIAHLDKQFGDGPRPPIPD